MVFKCIPGRVNGKVKHQRRSVEFILRITMVFLTDLTNCSLLQSSRRRVESTQSQIKWWSHGTIVRIKTVCNFDPKINICIGEEKKQEAIFKQAGRRNSSCEKV